MLGELLLDGDRQLLLRGDADDRGSRRSTARSVAVAASDICAAAAGVVSVPVVPAAAGAATAASTKAVTKLGVPPAPQSWAFETAIASLNRATKRSMWAPLSGGWHQSRQRLPLCGAGLGEPAL